MIGYGMHHRCSSRAICGACQPGRVQLAVKLRVCRRSNSGKQFYSSAVSRGTTIVRNRFIIEIFKPKFARIAIRNSGEYKS